MAPLGSPTKTAISPSSTTGLPMIEPSANPGRGTGFSHDVPSALRADQGGPDGPTPNATKPDPSAGNALGQAAFEGRRAIRPLEAVIRRPGKGDVAGARAEDDRVVAGGRRLGDATSAQEWVERRGRPRAGSIADPDPRDRRMCAIAVPLAEGQDAIAPRDRMPDRVRGAGERLARPGRAVVSRRPGDPVFAGRPAGCRWRRPRSAARRHRRSAPTPSESGRSTSFQVRSAADATGVAGAVALGEATATAVDAGEGVAVAAGATVAALGPQPASATTRDEGKQGSGEAARRRRGPQRRRFLRSDTISRAAFWPFWPVTPPPGMGAGTRQVEPVERQPVAGVAEQRPPQEELVEAVLAVHRMAAGQAVVALEVERGQDLARGHEPGQPRRVRRRASRRRGRRTPRARRPTSRRGGCTASTGR